MYLELETENTDDLIRLFSAYLKSDTNPVEYTVQAKAGRYKLRLVRIDRPEGEQRIT